MNLKHSLLVLLWHNSPLLINSVMPLVFHPFQTSFPTIPAVSRPLSSYMMSLNLLIIVSLPPPSVIPKVWTKAFILKEQLQPSNFLCCKATERLFPLRPDRLIAFHTQVPKTKVKTQWREDNKHENTQYMKKIEEQTKTAKAQCDYNIFTDVTDTKPYTHIITY